MTARPVDQVSYDHAAARKRVTDEIALALSEGQAVPCVDDPAPFDLAIDEPNKYVPLVAVRCSTCPGAVRRACGPLADFEAHGVYDGVESVESRRVREQQAATNRRKKDRGQEARDTA